MENDALKREVSPRAELLEMLKLEQTFVERGGYGSLVGTPREDPIPLRESVTCLNFGKTESEQRDPCDRCWLMAFVPGEHRSEVLPCHHITLNKSGETVASLRNADRDRLNEALCGWLRNSIAWLEGRAGTASKSC